MHARNVYVYLCVYVHRIFPHFLCVVMYLLASINKFMLFFITEMGLMESKHQEMLDLLHPLNHLLFIQTEHLRLLIELSEVLIIVVCIYTHLLREVNSHLLLYLWHGYLRFSRSAQCLYLD